MSYEINSTTYKATRELKAVDIFSGRREEYTIEKDTEMDSVWAFAVIVEEEDRATFKSLSQQECLDKKVELGYLTEE